MYQGKNYNTDNGDTLVIGGKIVLEDGATAEGFEGGGYSLPTAAADTKGGVKIGSGLSMDGEVLSADAQFTEMENIADLANDAELTDVVTKVNAILAALQGAGLMAED